MEYTTFEKSNTLTSIEGNIPEDRVDFYNNVDFIEAKLPIVENTSETSPLLW